MYNLKVTTANSSTKRVEEDGGVGVYVKDCLKYKIRKDVVNFEPHIEHI